VALLEKEGEAVVERRRQEQRVVVLKLLAAGQGVLVEVLAA
jgi:hypothetical protein